MFKARDRSHAAPAFDEAVTDCHAAGDKDLEVRSGYQAGRYRPEGRGWVDTVGDAASRFQDRAGETVGDVQDQAARVAGKV